MQNNSPQFEAAESALKAMESISKAAEISMRNPDGVSSSALASINSFTDQSSQKNLRQINSENLRVIHNLSKEPFLCRVRYQDEEGAVKTVFITRFGSLPGFSDIPLANRNAPVGRLASLRVGESELVKRGGALTELVVLEKLQVTAENTLGVWDSEKNRFSLDGEPVESFGSLRQLLQQKDAVVDIFSDLETGKTEAFTAQYLTQFALQDQPILDAFQDEIFRLPINSCYFLSGPPGTGKTTTLIRRLAQKLDITVLQDTGDFNAVSSSMRGVDGLKNSWIMFSPTSLLKHWVKEAFAKEDIPATDSRIVIWEDYRRNLARGTLGILTSGANTGFVMKQGADHLLQDTVIKNQISWFEDYHSYQSNSFFKRMTANSSWLSKSGKNDLSAIGKKCEIGESSKDKQSIGSILVRIEKLRDEIDKAYSVRSSEIDALVGKHITLLHNSDPSFIGELREEIARISSKIKTSNVVESDIDDDEIDDDDPDTNETTRNAGPVRSPAAVLRAALKSYIKAHQNGKKVKQGTLYASLISWLNIDRMPRDEILSEVGMLMDERKRLATFRNVFTKYLRNSRTLYRSFRRVRTREKKWYKDTPSSGRFLSPQEVDVVILSIFKNAREILNAAPKSMISTIQETSLLAAIIGELKTQVMIDEATDFSPIQLSIMYHLSDPSLRSVFLSGDFNQRLTSEGAKTTEELLWAVPDVEEKPIAVSYRQSKTLMNLGQKIIESDSGVAPILSQPDGVDIASINPVSVEGLSDTYKKAKWLGSRIAEIANIVPSGIFPSIAILVDDDDRAVVLAKELSNELELINLRAVACLGGEALGSGNDVRIYDKKYIKGLEFEAVFLLDADILEMNRPDLFMKYLYVAASRARTFFGVASEKEMPSIFSNINFEFQSDWASI